MAPDKKSLTLHHILTMSAGLDWFEPIDYTNPGNDEIRMIESPDPAAFTLGCSLRNEPGQGFQYNGGQRIFILQPYDMVVVVTAGNYNTGDVELSGSDVLMEYVFPSLGLPEVRFVPAGGN
jgi:hypothetical protein